MFKCYLKLVIFFAVQHRILSAEPAVDEEHALHVLRRSTSGALRTDVERKPENAEEKSKVQVDSGIKDKVTESSTPAFITPVVTSGPHHHHHHRHRSGNATNEYKSQTTPLQPTNNLQNNTNVIVKTNENQDKKENSTSNSKLNETQTERENVKSATQNRRFNVQNNGKVTPAFPFYRRLNYLDEAERNKPQKWTHCLDLITPRLKGYKEDWKHTQFNSSHPDVMRLIQLIKVDVSNYTQSEIESILFQVSNIHLRLFRWDVSAITTVLNVLIAEPKHNFKNFKAGVKALFAKWHLDTTMMEVFLKQTKIFRPPCIDTSGLAGSTKKSEGQRYTLPNEKKSVSTYGGLPAGSFSCSSEEGNKKL